MKYSKVLATLLIATSAMSAKADVLGAVAGGLIGSQFGQGNGRVAMAAVGAVIGDRLTAPTPTYVPQPQYQGYYQGQGTYYQNNHRVYIDGRDGLQCPYNGYVICQQWSNTRPVVVMPQ